MSEKITLLKCRNIHKSGKTATAMPVCSARRSKKASVEFDNVKSAMTTRKRLKLPSNSLSESFIFGAIESDAFFGFSLTKKTMTNKPKTTGIEA